jgi:hypothetical protein
MVEGGDAEVDAIKAFEDVDERRRHNRGGRGGNGRVDAEVDAIKLPERRGAGWVCQTQRCVEDESTHRHCQYRAYKVEGPNHASAFEGHETVTLTMWLCWTKKKQCSSGRVGEQGSATKRQPASRAQRPCDGRKAGLSDGAGSGSSMTKTQLAARRPCANGWRSKDCVAQ